MKMVIVIVLTLFAIAIWVALVTYITTRAYYSAKFDRFKIERQRYRKGESEDGFEENSGEETRV